MPEKAKIFLPKKFLRYDIIKYVRTYTARLLKKLITNVKTGKDAGDNDRNIRESKEGTYARARREQAEERWEGCRSRAVKTQEEDRAYEAGGV